MIKNIYIPFQDGSSIAFDGENFSIQRVPVNDEHIINNKQSEAEKNWSNNKIRLKIMKALQDAWQKQREIKRSQDIKQVYNKF